MSRFMSCDWNWAESEIVLFGAPFDGTVTNRPGARFAPGHIRMDSYGLETFSPYFDLDIEDLKIHDYGDLDLPFGNTEAALEIIEDFVDRVLEDEKKLLMAGGEHLVSLPAIKKTFEKYPDLCVLHFDAHADLRREYMGISLSHSTVVYKSWELLGDNRIWQFGIRSGTKEEFHWAGQGHVSMNKFNFEGLKEAVSEIGQRPIYLTVDLDVLDTSVFPGTGTPEPGGVTFKELLNALMTLKGLNFVGADVVELSPNYDSSGISTAAACKIIREIFCLLGKKQCEKYVKRM